jgi:chromosome segregation ATPase
VVVRDLKAGLAVWNRNGFYSTLVTPDGEVIDPMGIVTGGSDAPLEGSFLSQRRRIRELRSLLAELDGQLQVETLEIEKLEAELAETETKKSLLAVEIHRLEVERVRLEHEGRAADEASARLTQTVQALVQERSDLTTALHLLNDEIRQCHINAETRAREKNAREQRLVEKQAEVI